MRSSRAGISECVMVGATFTPVPQGCRAGKAQVVIRSLEAVSLTGQGRDAASRRLQTVWGRWSTDSLLTASTRRH